MAKKKVTTVTVADLADEFGIDGRKIRMAIRASGRKAPEVKDQEGFGPRARYEWKSNSKELKEIRNLLEELAAKEKKAIKKTKKSKKKEEDESTTEDEEEEDEDEVDDDDVDEDEEEDD